MKTLYVSALAAASIVLSSCAHENSKESAKSLRDDTWVTLRGNIVERISDDLYVFKDASGTINVDIDHKRWNGVTVTPKDTVEIQGEVDKDWNSVEIDVKQIRKVNP